MSTDTIRDLVRQASQSLREPFSRDFAVTALSAPSTTGSRMGTSDGMTQEVPDG